MLNLILALPGGVIDGGADTPAAEPFGLGTFLPIILIGLFFYFFMIRPANRKEKNRRVMLKALRKHDKIVTTGGIWGIVTAIDEKQETVTLEVSQGMRLKVSRSAIHSVNRPEEKDDAGNKKKPRKVEAKA